MNTSQLNQSLTDGLACLQALALFPEPVGSRELARLLDLEPARTNRLLRTLAHVGLAEQDSRRKYRPGPGIHVLAAQSLIGSGLIRRAGESLESLGSLGYRVALGVLWRNQMCYLYQAGPGVPMSQAFTPRVLYPAASSGLGMALMAHKSDEEIRALYSGAQLELSWQRSIEPPVLDGEDGLLARLARVREQGYALVDIPTSDDWTLGVALGHPPYAAVGLSGTFADDEVPNLVAVLRDVTAQIESNASVDHEVRAD